MSCTLIKFIFRKGDLLSHAVHGLRLVHPRATLPSAIACRFLLSFSTTLMQTYIFSSTWSNKHESCIILIGSLRVRSARCALVCAVRYSHLYDKKRCSHLFSYCGTNSRLPMPRLAGKTSDPRVAHSYTPVYACVRGIQFLHDKDHLRKSYCEGEGEACARFRKWFGMSLNLAGSSTRTTAPSRPSTTFTITT